MAPTRPKRSYDTSEEHEGRIQAAKVDFLQGKFKSIRATARAHDVSLDSLILLLHLLNALLGGSSDTV